jgi:hypothetical protein
MFASKKESRSPGFVLQQNPCPNVQQLRTSPKVYEFASCVISAEPSQIFHDFTVTAEMLLMPGLGRSKKSGLEKWEGMTAANGRCFVRVEVEVECVVANIISSSLLILKLVSSPHEPNLLHILLQERTRHLISTDLWIPDRYRWEILFLIPMIRHTPSLRR